MRGKQEGILMLRLLKPVLRVIVKILEWIERTI